jgi:hypothetical protein
MTSASYAKESGARDFFLEELFSPAAMSRMIKIIFLCKLSTRVLLYSVHSPRFCGWRIKTYL